MWTPLRKLLKFDDELVKSEMTVSGLNKRKKKMLVMLSLFLNESIIWLITNITD